MAELIRDIGQYFIDNSHGIEIGQDIFLNYRPDQPDNITCIYEYAGHPVEPGIEALQRKVQILVRDLDDLTCEKRSWDLFKICDIPEQRIITTNSGRWMVTQAMQSPFKLEIDPHNRTIYIFNLSITASRD
jgi:hypothetical protein